MIKSYVVPVQIKVFPGYYSRVSQSVSYGSDNTFTNECVFLHTINRFALNYASAFFRDRLMPS